MAGDFENWLGCESQLNRQLENLKVAEQEIVRTSEIVQHLQDEWQNWLKERGFEVKIRPEGFETIIQIIEKGRTAEKSLIEDQRRLMDIEQYIEGARNRIRTVLDLCGEDQVTKELGVERISVMK